MPNSTAWHARSAARKAKLSGFLNPHETWMHDGSVSTTKPWSCPQPASERYGAWSWWLPRLRMLIVAPDPRTPGLGLRDGRCPTINGKREHDYNPRSQKTLPLPPTAIQSRSPYRSES